MAITTTSITGVIALPDGTIPSKSSVTFTMTGFDTDATAGVTIAPRSVTSVLSDTGALDVDLWSNEDGERTTFYSVSLNIYNGTNPLVFDAGKIEVPTTGGPYDLNDLLPIAPPQGATVAEYIAQLQAAAASATSAADSAAIDAAAAAVDADDAAISAQEAAVSAASINPTNFLAKADNLAGIANTGTARTNLGLGTAATSATGDFATAAQGTKADNALPAADKATQLEAETGTDNDKYMTPLRTAEAISAQAGLSPVKAWVNFNGTGTVAIRDSLNVTSITDNGVGSFIVNFTDDFADTDYMAIASCQAQAAQDSHIINIHNTNNTSAAVERAPLVGSMAVSICSRGNFAKDSAYVSVMVIGG
jgi:hypothetical protein